MKNPTTLEIICSDEVDMAGEWEKADVEEEIREILEREPKENEWIEWVISHDDIDDRLPQEIIDAICMPEFVEGTFEVDGTKFKFVKS